VLEISRTLGGERAVIDQHGPFELPLRLLLATGRHRVGLRAEQKAEASVEVDVEAGATRTLAEAEVASATASRAEASPTAKALLDRARQRLAAGDPRAARNLYRELRRAYPGSSEAATVLVTLGKLELELGAPERALAAFDAYTDHGGALVPEAMSGRIRALRALGRHGDERRAIEQYLARYPTGFEASALRKRLSTLTSG
jgi:TolA-binding protein